MKSCIVLLMILLPVLASPDVFGQKVIREQRQFWWSVNTSARLSERVGVIADFHVRRNDFLNETNFYFARIGGAFWVSDQLTLVAGVAHLWLSRPLAGRGIYQDENRIYQQIQWRQNVGRVTFVQRIRNEHRWHEVLDSEGNYLRTRFSNRVRFLSSLTLKAFENEKLPKFVLAGEVHIHFGKEIIYNTFDQNRIFGGVKVPLRKNLSFDLGYMMVYQQSYSGNEYDMNHTLRWFFYYSPDFRKNKDLKHYPLPGDE